MRCFGFNYNWLVSVMFSILQLLKNEFKNAVSKVALKTTRKHIPCGQNKTLKMEKIVEMEEKTVLTVL